MPINVNDLAYLIDIYENSIDIISFTKDVKYIEFEKSIMRRKAVERSFEIIGEAANRISKETLLSLPNIPWSKIIAFRNKIAHDYGEILIEFIWNISQKNIPELLNELMKINDLMAYLNNNYDE